MAFDIDIPDEWEKEWRGMPEYTKFDQCALHTIMIHFETMEDMQKFSDLIGGRRITKKTISIWFPEKERRIRGIFIDKDQLNDDLPVPIDEEEDE